MNARDGRHLLVRGHGRVVPALRQGREAPRREVLRAEELHYERIDRHCIAAVVFYRDGLAVGREVVVHLVAHENTHAGRAAFRRRELHGQPQALRRARHRRRAGARAPLKTF